jgi:hypothetical protein
LAPLKGFSGAAMSIETSNLSIGAQRSRRSTIVLTSYLLISFFAQTAWLIALCWIAFKFEQFFWT